MVCWFVILYIFVFGAEFVIFFPFVFFFRLQYTFFSFSIYPYFFYSMFGNTNNENADSFNCIAIELETGTKIIAQTKYAKSFDPVVTNFILTTPFYRIWINKRMNEWERVKINQTIFDTVNLKKWKITYLPNEISFYPKYLIERRRNPQIILYW